MTGSIRSFIYQADDTTNYGVKKDESAGEATVGGVVLFSNYTAGTPRIPVGLRKRYCNAVLSTDSAVRRVFEVGNRALFQTITVGSQIIEAAGGLAAGGTYNVLSKVGERNSFLVVSDTGQIDGDNP